MMIEIVSMALSAVIVFYLIFTDKFLYPEIFINTMIIFMGIKLIYVKFWEVVDPFASILIFGVIGYGVLYAAKALGDKISELKEVRED